MISPERSQELLRVYAATRCGAAFRELVGGWTGMVYATALRVARGEEALAEDITQTVFSRLATAPEKVKDARALGAWLHAAATGSTLAALRLEARRRRREETSQDLIIMHTPEPPAPDAGDGGHALTPEIDGALSKLPPQDSQLLLMRFWQQQDWRSIGRTFGLSDDAAQKRMSRALERLRRILARRGITSTAGVLSAVLAGTVPRDLPAATVLKIISATQASISTSTVLTTIVMTTKTKVTIAAAAVLLAATAPLVYQQQRIAALQGEVQSLQQRALVPVLKKAPVAVFAEETGFARAVPAKLQDLPEPPSPERSSLFGAAMDKGGPHDYDTLHRRQVKEKLAALRKRLSLTPDQETEIAKALEYGQMKTKIIDNDVKVFRASADDKKKMEDGIIASLTAGQQKEYESFRAEEKANAVEAVANRELSRLQSMTTLSPEQKDQAFAAFSEIVSRESMQDLPEPGGNREAMKGALEARWADRQEALGAILTPEQMAIYQQAGNPFVARGPGG
jgi:RNA polymerase sigma factor (sigma-70 family)